MSLLVLGLWAVTLVYAGGVLLGALRGEMVMPLLPTLVVMVLWALFASLFTFDVAS